MKEWFKKAGKWLIAILEDVNGVPSSKRIQSFGLIIFGCILAAASYDFNVVALCFGAGIGLQGVTAFQR